MSIARNSLYGMAGALLPLTASIVTIPLYIERIGAARYGMLSIAWLLLAYFGQADFGIGRSVTQRISATARDDPARLAQVVWSALAMIGLVSLVLAAVIYVAASWYFAGPFEVDEALRAEMLDAVWILALCAPVVAVSGVFWGVLAGLERFALISVGNFASTLALQVVPLLVAIAFGPHLAYLILASLGSRMLMLLILGAGSWFWTLRGRPVKTSGTEMRHLGGFGAWVMITSLAGPLMAYTDRFAIGSMLGAAAVAAYSIPAIVTGRTQMIPTMIAQALFPRFAAEDADTSRARCRDYIVFMGQFYAPIVIGVMCLAAPLLAVWLGQELDERSIAVGQIIMVGWWFNALSMVPFAFIQARGNPRFLALLNLAEMPLYFAALFLFGRAWGLTGVVSAFALRCAVDCLALLWRAGMLERVLLQRLAAPAFLIALALVFGSAMRGWLSALSTAAVLGLASLAVLWLQMPLELRDRVGQWPAARRIAGLVGMKL